MDAINNIVNRIASAFANAFPGMDIGRLVVTAGILLLLAIVFLCVMISKSRSCKEIYGEYERVSAELRERDEDARRAKDELKRTKDTLEGELEKVKSEKDDAVGDLTAQLDVLKQFYEKYKVVPDAEKEASRIMNDAKDKAFLVANRTEKEYIELIEQANNEAEAIRHLAQERLTRSHETLKTAIARANEIVDEARSEARSVGVTYVPQPARIQAPIEAEAEEEPTLEDEKQ